MKLQAYKLHDHAVVPRLAEQPEGHGRAWLLTCPRGFQVTWNGGPRPEDVEICVDGADEDEPSFVQSLHGHGVITFHPGCQIKTDEPYGLWIEGPLEVPLDGIAPLERLVDTTHMPCTVVVHWQLTRAHHPLRFAAGRPFARMRLYPWPRPTASAGGQPLEVELVEYASDSDHDEAFVRMVDTAALDGVFLRLGAEVAPRPAAPLPDGAEPPSPLPPGCFDTIDGRIDLRSFAPGFFHPERFPPLYADALRDHGQVQLRDFFILDQRRLVFLSVPKVACTAIKLALAAANGAKVPEDERLHQHVHVLPSWHREHGTLRPAQDGFHRFAFVRNPFDRLVSCYRSKISFEPSDNGQRPLYEGYYFALPANMAFDEFVRRVAAIPDALADNHFKSQHALLYERGVLMVDEVGRFEQLDAHWTALAERFGLEPGLRVSNVSKGKRGNDDFREYYTEELVQLVYERYRKDVHTFGYEADHQALLAFVRERQPAREQRPS